jgi:D-serine deaminase-like pyridoxal phosphate-dependent protein
METESQSPSTAGVTVFGGDFTFPMPTLRRDAVAHNAALMGRFCADLGVELAPHARTTMAPQLFARQLDAGAWGLTAATIDQVQVYRAFGVRRVLLANELVDGIAIAWLREELRADPGFEFLCYVDSAEGVAMLDDALTGAPAVPPVAVLVELGHAGGRTGCSVAGYCRELVALLRSLPRTGCWTTGRRARDRAAGARRQRLSRRGRPRAGRGARGGDGGAAPRLVPGADDGMYERLSPLRGQLRPALELWAQVLSRPEPDLTLLGLDRRDVGFDPRACRYRSGYARARVPRRRREACPRPGSTTTTASCARPTDTRWPRATSSR